MYQWYRGFIQGKTRATAAWIFAILLGVLARDTPYWPGIVICFIGASLRFWASGYILKDSKLAVGGPYSIVRNPLYLGTYLMAVGVAMAVQNIYLLLAVTILFAGVYHYIILDEETKLKTMFGPDYAVYCGTVPRFFPKPWPVSSEKLRPINPEVLHFSWNIAIKNKAYEAYATFIALIGYVWAASYLWNF